MPSTIYTACRVAARWTAAVVGPALVSLGLSGCAEFWDHVTSRDFQIAELWTAKPNPLVVLAESHNGDKRAEALRALREPKQFGGTDKDQETYLNILVIAAKSDSQPLCRLAAIQSLGRFKDPRAVQGLIDAYFAAVEPTRKTPTRPELMYASKTFPTETATIIQVEALTALGETKNPAAVELLARVARPEPTTAVESEAKDKQQVMDVKIAAVRALGNFKHYQATETLVSVLEKEKDVALRNRAVESLELATGKKLGDDPKAWEEVLHNSSGGTNVEGPSRDEGSKLKVVSWINGWF